MFYPSQLNVFLTERCNLECRYCFINNNNISVVDKFDKAAIAKAIDHFLKISNPKKAIGFTGGEPFLFYDRLKSFFFLKILIPN